MNYNITKFPVIILSTPRSGSTTLAYDIQEALNVKLFNEPLNNKNTLLEYNEYKKTSNHYILKVHACDIGKLDDNNLKTRIQNNDCFLIRIRRQNVIQQITSYYIELMRGMWGYYTGIYLSDNIKSAIKHDTNKMRNAIEIILKANKSSNELNIPINLDLWYEDLELPSHILYQTPKPENFTEIKQIIEYYLNLQKR